MLATRFVSGCPFCFVRRGPNPIPTCLLGTSLPIVRFRCAKSAAERTRRPAASRAATWKNRHHAFYARRPRPRRRPDAFGADRPIDAILRALARRAIPVRFRRARVPCFAQKTSGLRERLAPRRDGLRFRTRLPFLARLLNLCLCAPPTFPWIAAWAGSRSRFPSPCRSSPRSRGRRTPLPEPAERSANARPQIARLVPITTSGAQGIAWVIDRPLVPWIRAGEGAAAGPPCAPAGRTLTICFSKPQSGTQQACEAGPRPSRGYSLRPEGESSRRAARPDGKNNSKRESPRPPPFDQPSASASSPEEISKPRKQIASRPRAHRAVPKL